MHLIRLLRGKHSGFRCGQSTAEHIFNLCFIMSLNNRWSRMHLYTFVLWEVVEDNAVLPNTNKVHKAGQISVNNNTTVVVSLPVGDRLKLCAGPQRKEVQGFDELCWWYCDHLQYMDAASANEIERLRRNSEDKHLKNESTQTQKMLPVVYPLSRLAPHGG